MLENEEKVPPSSENEVKIALESNGLKELNKKECTVKLLEQNKDNTENTFKICETQPKSIIRKQFDKIKMIRGYIFGILFAFSMCMANILIKMAPSLDGANHACIRYFIQLVVMLIFIKKNNLKYFGPKNQRKLLILRGVVGSLTVIFSFFAIRYLDVSDVETITNSSVLITAVFSRIFLKEKLTISHVFAIFLTITGVVFVIRPSFLFGIEHNIENIFHLNLTGQTTTHSLAKSLSNSTLSSKSLLLTNVSSILPKHKPTDIIDHSNREMLETIFGVVLVLLSATCMSISHVSIRKLNLGKTHFSITSAYPAYIGIPTAIIFSLVLIFTKYSHADLDDEADSLLLQIFYSLCSGTIGTMGLIFLNLALKYEDATKIGMTKTTGVIFSFILQFIFIGIGIDFLGIIGAFLVIFSILTVMIIKIFEKRLNKSAGCFFKLLATKF